MAISMTVNDFTSFDINRFYLYLLDNNKVQLSEEEFEELAFLLADDMYVSAVSVRHSKSLSNAILIYRKAITDERKIFHIILEALYFIGRYDIMKQCGVKKMSNSWKQYENYPFGNLLWRKRVLIYKIYEQLNDQEIEESQKRLSLKHDLLAPAIGAQPNSLLSDIFTLEQDFSLRPEQYEFNMMELVRDLAHCSTHAKNVRRQYKRYCNDLDNGEMPEPIRPNKYRMETEIAFDQQISAVSESGESLPETSSQFDQEDIPTSFTTGDLSVAPLFSQCTNSMDFYPIKQSPKGFCLIFNNEKYQNNIPPRIGTKKDMDKIVALFKKLEFEVRPFTDVTSAQMKTYLKQISSSSKLKNHDLFVCFILSHGTLSNVVGIDGVDISIYDLTSLFNSHNCKGLRNKPKLFFIQACQGDKNPKACMPDDVPYPTPVADEAQSSPQTPPQASSQTPPVLNRQVTKDSGNSSADWTVKEAIPSEADFLFGMSTFRGYKSYRSKSKGTFYITKLCEILEKHYLTHDILRILTLVNSEMSGQVLNVQGEYFVQIPSPAYTLRKLCYLCETNKLFT